MDILLSVVVPSFNSEKFLGETLLSIEANQHPNVEYIFVDGGSKDRTMEIFEPYRHLFSTVISEPDQGQSDALNKGFLMARGKFVTWLNSDDLMNVNSLGRVIHRLKSTRSLWLAANVAHIDKNGCIIRCRQAGGFEHVPVKLGLLNVFGPSTFVAKKLFEEIGRFDLNFHYCMDTEYWWRIVAAGYRFERINCYFWGFRLHEDAKTSCLLLKTEIPEGIKTESRSIQNRFYPFKSRKFINFSILVARIQRFFNLSMIRSYLDTKRYLGSHFYNIDR